MRWLALLVSLASLSSPALAFRVCTGDLTAFRLHEGIRKPVVRACLRDEAKGVAIVVTLRADDAKQATTETVPGETVRIRPGVYENRHVGAEGPVLVEVRLTRKDRIRAEGAMADHYEGSVVWNRSDGKGGWNALYRLDGAHFYTEAPDSRMHWSYGTETGPERWGKLRPEYEACLEGREQSPIALEAAKEGPRKSGAPVLEVRYGDSRLSQVNNGHALQANVSGENVVTFRGKRYRLLQFHVHTPGEHTIDGRRPPMEVHMVHQEMDGRAFLVLGAFVDAVESGPHDRQWRAILDAFPRQVNAPKELPGQLDLRWLLPATLDFSSYRGSLTTPPCTEGVQWVLLKEHLSLRRDLIPQVTRLIGGDNARTPAQPLFGRVVESAR